MGHLVSPVIRKWYQDEDRHEIFKVVAEDISEGLVEVQYFSGEIEELDFDTWFSLNLRLIPEPEDSSGPFELSQEDLGYGSEDRSFENWSGAFSDLEPSDEYDSYFDSFKNSKDYDD